MQHSLFISLLLILGVGQWANIQAQKTSPTQAQTKIITVALLENTGPQKPLANASVYLKVRQQNGRFRRFNPNTNEAGQFTVYLPIGQSLNSVVFDEISQSLGDSTQVNLYTVKQIDEDKKVIWVAANNKINTKESKPEEAQTQLFTVNLIGISELSVSRALLKVNEGNWVNLDKNWRTTLRVKTIDPTSRIRVALEGNDQGSFEAIHESKMGADTLVSQPSWRKEQNSNLIVITFRSAFFEPNPGDSLKTLIAKGTEQIKELRDDFNAQVDTFERRLDTLKARKFVDQQALNQLAQEFADYREKMQNKIKYITNTLIVSLLPYNDSLRNKLLREPIDTVLNFLNRKKAEIQQLKAAQAQQQQRANRTILIISVAGLLIITLLVLWYFKKLRSTNRSLTSKNTLINLLIGEVNHRVKNNLFSISSKLRNSYMQSNNEATKTTLDELINFTAKLSQLQAKLDFTFFSTDKKIIQGFQIEQEMREMAETVVTTSVIGPKPALIIKNDLAGLRNDNFSIIGFCAFELINNICKYAFTGAKQHTNQENPKVKLLLTKKGSYISLRITDNGKGITSELFDQQGTFNFDQLHSSKGLKIINHLTLLQKGFFEIKTAALHADIAQGTCFECNFKF